ncbi:MAG: hypothetical protein H6658_19980 [Ardenticatenaceae bacterium]|nr:hypothetical protein [Ardenticatenaceae bacterium]
MIRKTLFLCACLLFLILLIVQPATAVAPLPPRPSPLPPRPAATCDPDGSQTSGAIYRLCVPNNWNGDLLVYAHGYVSPTAPIGIPEDQISIGGNSIIDLVNLLGYAFATTSYSTNGLAIQPGLTDIIDLLDIFAAQYGPPNHTYLAGVSEGGIITALALEHYPDRFDGGLAMCGPYGDFGAQVNYFGDFRVLFDYYFPGLMPGDPTNIPQSLIDNWDNHYNSTILPAISDPANAYTTTQLLTTANALYAPAPAITNTATIERLLWYNVFATNDAALKLGGQPYSNTHRIYTGSDDDAALNAGVIRVSGDQAALDEIAAHYITTGSLSRPIVTLHTTADPVVPYWHSPLYAAKIHGPALHDHFAAERYGHCAFTVDEVLAAYGRLLTLTTPQQNYLPIIISPPATDRP